MISAAHRAPQLGSILEELELPCSVRLRSASSAARAVAKRLGAGKLRHLEAKYLGIQQLAQTKRLEIVAVRTDLNSSDTGTKYLDGDTLKRLCLLVNTGAWVDLLNKMRDQRRTNKIVGAMDYKRLEGLS
eukprot:14681525-Alexandrium_andersonii.AAC.1